MKESLCKSSRPKVSCTSQQSPGQEGVGRRLPLGVASKAVCAHWCLQSTYKSVLLCYSPFAIFSHSLWPPSLQQHTNLFHIYTHRYRVDKNVKTVTTLVSVSICINFINIFWITYHLARCSLRCWGYVWEAVIWKLSSWRDRWQIGKNVK